MSYSRAAFTLVELSTVLVILGLLVGGVLAGQSLIRAAELRAITSEYERYTAATFAFRDKYFGLPGDITNATSFWGQSANCPGTYNQGTSNGTTCNGNGDGQIYFTGAYASPTANEVPRVWQHLANAGLIEGSYNGVTTATADNYFWGVGSTNAPRSKAGSNIAWSLLYMPNASNLFAAGLIFAYDMTAYAVGGIIPTNAPATGFLLPQEAWNLDTKMDDGRPGRGKVQGTVGNSCTDAATGYSYDASYLLTQTGKTCFMIMRLF